MTVTMKSSALTNPSTTDPSATRDCIIVKAGTYGNTNAETNFAKLTFNGVRIVTDSNVSQSPVTVFADGTINAALELTLADGSKNILSSEGKFDTERAASSIDSAHAVCRIEPVGSRRLTKASDW